MRFLRPSRTVEISLLAIRYSNCRFPMESSRAPSLMLARIRSSESIVDGAYCKLHFLLKRLAFSLQPHGQNAGRSAVGCGVAYVRKNKPKSRKGAPAGGGTKADSSPPAVRPLPSRGPGPISCRMNGRDSRPRSSRKKERALSECAKCRLIRESRCLNFSLEIGVETRKAPLQRKLRRGFSFGLNQEKLLDAGYRSGLFRGRSALAFCIFPIIRRRLLPNIFERQRRIIDSILVQYLQHPRLHDIFFQIL
jgi:hypothetical protein